MHKKLIESLAVAAVASASLVAAGAGTSQAQALPAGSVDMPAVQLPQLPTADQALAQVRAALPPQVLDALPPQVRAAVGLGAPAAGAGFADVAGPGLGAAVSGEVNAYRASRGLAPLAGDGGLDAEAQGWANTIAARNVVEHNQGYLRRGGGENIVAADAATCDARCLVTLWKNSPGHDENLVDPGYRAAGVGVAYAADGKVYVVQDYRY